MISDLAFFLKCITKIWHVDFKVFIKNNEHQKKGVSHLGGQQWSIVRVEESWFSYKQEEDYKGNLWDFLINYHKGCQHIDVR